MNPNGRLKVYQLSKDSASQQCLIDRAEEDLFCASWLLRRRKYSSFMPHVTICFLLHQATEKWLKLFLVTASLPEGSASHALRERFERAGGKEPDFLKVKDRIGEVDEEILENRFPGNLRYNETPEEVEDYIKILLYAAFRTRRLVKRFLKTVE